MSVTQHLVNVSGGKDSTAVYLLAMESGRPFRAVFADTGNEHDAVYEYLAALPGRTGGPPIETVRADFTRQLAKHRDYLMREWPKQGIAQEIVDRAAALHTSTGNPYLDLCITRGRFPSRLAQFCTEELKIIPMTDQIVIPMLKAGRVLQWLGIRADESFKRAKQRRYNRVECGAYVWRPIFRWTVEDVWAMHKKHNVPRNPLYDQGMSRVGCMPCINCRKGELLEISKRFPEHIDRIEEWERIIRASNKGHASTYFASVNDPAQMEREGNGDIRSMVDWATTARGGRQYQMFMDNQRGGGCDSDLGVCET